MNRKDELIFRALTRHSFPTPASAVPLLQSFVEAGDPFTPTHYGSHEPVHTPFSPTDLAAPAQMLSDPPRELLLKRSRPSLLANLCWMVNRARPWPWTIRFGPPWTHGKACETSRLANFLIQVCCGFSPVFAACATFEDWSLKHTIRDPETNEDRGMRGMILNPGEGLPGVYWLTFFGAELVGFFGRKQLKAMRAHLTIDCGSSGIGIMPYESPTEGTSAWRRELEAGIVQALGTEYFFDLAQASRKRPRRRTQIPRATDHR